MLTPDLWQLPVSLPVSPFQQFADFLQQKDKAIAAASTFGVGYRGGGGGGGGSERERERAPERPAPH